MKKTHLWMMLGCLVLAAVALALPSLGWQFAGAPLLAAVLMAACCLGPVLLVLGGSKGGCCGGDSEKTSKKSDDKGHSGPSCH
jgi:membrane protein implicated in regulation of membrane protease activity